MSTDKDNNSPHTRELRHAARDKMVEACEFLAGRPGMSYAEQLHNLSHAKIALTEAVMAVELASHNVIMFLAEKEIFDHGMSDLEDMLTTAAEKYNNPQTEGDAQ